MSRMTRRFQVEPPINRDQRVARAYDTLDFCAAIYQIHAQAGSTWDAELLSVKAMQRAALAVFHDDCQRWDWQ